MKQSIISRNRAQGVEGLYFSMRPMNSDELPKAASEYPQAFLTCEAMTASTEQYLNNVGVLARAVEESTAEGEGPYIERYKKAAPLISALLGAHAAATAALDAVLQWFFGDDPEALKYFQDDAGGDDAAEITTDTNSGEN